MNDNVYRFPTRGEKRRRQRLRERRVSCQVSERWLQIGESVRVFTGEGIEYLHVDVMTLDQHEQPRKLCELIRSTRSA